MIKAFKYILITTISLACIYSKSVVAHKLNAAETNINFNERTNAIEVIHRFYLHDVNHLIQQHYAKYKKNEEESEYQVFVKYILNNLELNFQAASNKNLPISYIGSEQENKHFYIYQELKLGNSKELGKVSVSIESMRNGWKPNYWLFSIQLSNLKDNFILEKSTLEKTFTLNNKKNNEKSN